MRNFLVVQWLRLPASSAGGVGSISGQGTEISAILCMTAKKIKKKKTKKEIALTSAGAIMVE